MMSLTIKNKPKPKPKKKAKVRIAEPVLAQNTNIDIDIEQIEVFGRLRIGNAVMAEYYGISPSTMSTYMNRTDFKAAYNRGRAETVIAVRQKQLTNALAGDNRMLIFAGEHFADQDAASLETSKSPTGGLSGRSWDGWVKAKALELRDEIVKQVEK